MLQGKRVLLGVCGSIAAYKAALLTRLLVKQGAEVKIILTSAASQFITPLTLATLSKNPVLTNFTGGDDGTWTNHVELGLWANVFVIAPASANTLAKVANGLADNLLIATYLSARCPVVFAPAMDLDMYVHGSTLANLDKLKSYGNHIIEAGTGELASGLHGQGRMAEPDEIVTWLENHFAANPHQAAPAPVAKSTLPTPLKVLITAGPTREHWDPVRFLTNHSSGKMGYALAQTAANAGANVSLVSGPVAITPPQQAKVTGVQSAIEMLEAVKAQSNEADIIIFCAAVADYRPADVHEQKFKKNLESISLQLVKNPDVAGIVSNAKKPGQVTVGFALETENGEENALAKLTRKNLDIIVLNTPTSTGTGFGYDTNSVTIIDKYNNRHQTGLLSKAQVAQAIWQFVMEYRLNHITSAQ